MSRVEHRSPVTQHRVAGGQVRAAAASRGIFTARAVQYGVVDLYGSVWAPGCFDASLAKRLPVILFGHDHVEPVGRATSWHPTPEGPEVTAQLDLSPDVPKGRQAAAQLASGTLTDVSVGFLTTRKRAATDDELKKWPGAREVILAADMLELSLVGVGAVPGAVVLSSRSASLARQLAEGRISPARYRSEMDLEDDLEAALERVAKWAPRTRASMVAERISERATDPVAKWMAIAEAKAATEAAEAKAQAERARAERERDQAQQQRRHDNPFSSWI